ncbi:MAG: DUF2147 domain-containing protein [Marinifilaceae bacterium]|jgi:uncharacterized protein (DUF2147 family)|nr:DUF2147 domain-containing protein [Marinifilaceae bacterium]
MKTTKFMFSLIGIIMLLMFNQRIKAQSKENSIIGIWETENKDGRMQIFKKADEFQAKLLWGKEIVNADGSSKKDLKNPDPKLRKRDIVGMTYLLGLKYSENQWENGKIYNSSNGKWYHCYVWTEKGKLFLRGYLGVKMLGQTTKWNRVKKIDKTANK